MFYFSKPARIRILIALGQGEACVCHLEAVLGLRQSYISQHLMALRSAGLLETRREGKFVYYRLSDQRALSLVEGAAAIAGIPKETLNFDGRTGHLAMCGCPKCQAAAFVDLVDVA